MVQGWAFVSHSINHFQGSYASGMLLYHILRISGVFNHYKNDIKINRKIFFDSRLIPDYLRVPHSFTNSSTDMTGHSLFPGYLFNFNWIFLDHPSTRAMPNIASSLDHCPVMPSARKIQEIFLGGGVVIMTVSEKGNRTISISNIKF